MWIHSQVVLFLSDSEWMCCWVDVQVVNEVKDSSDARELLFGSILQADMLTQVINERITAEHVQHQTSDDSSTCKLV